MIQWLFVTSKLQHATKDQTSTGQRQLYAVWRATEQAHEAVAVLETLLSTVNASQTRKTALIHESRALRELGISPPASVESADSISSSTSSSTSTSTGKIEEDYTQKRRVLEMRISTAHDEFNKFANALSSSLSWMSVTGGLNASESSQNGNLDLSMEQLTRTTTILAAALSNELKSVPLISKEWGKLASTATSTAHMLYCSQKHEEDCSQKRSRPPFGQAGSVLANAFDRTSRAIDNM